MKTKLRYYWRFKEQDGSWSPWEECSYNTYLRYIGDPDVDLMALGSE